PNDGVGARVRQSRWLHKGIDNSWWEVTRVSLKNQSRNGKVWGRLYWRGETPTGDEKIEGGLRYNWVPMSSTPTPSQTSKSMPSG
ncbi:hypothetical protein SISSUDRAFT_959530, partial [Sistotremastrum suecicum HHB10207 ss-3]